MSESYTKWKRVIEAEFPDLGFSAEACMSATAQLWFEDIQLPPMLILVGPPASFKTTAINFLSHKAMPDLVYYTDHFTPAAFVSHKSDVDEAKLAKIDMLPKIINKVFEVPELAPTFTSELEKLKTDIGILTRLADGQGYTSNSGSHGQRGYSGAMKFAFLGATTPISHQVWQVMGGLGTKLYFLHMPKSTMTDDEMVELLMKNEYKQKMAKCVAATCEFVADLRKRTPVKWQNDKSDKKAYQRIIAIARLLARLRASVNVSVQDAFNQETGEMGKVGYNLPNIEDCTRAAIILTNFTRGYAFIKGRNWVEMDDVRIALEIALSSAPEDRVKAFDAIIRNGGSATTTQLERLIGCSDMTAARAMETLNILKIVTKTSETVTDGRQMGGRPTNKYKLVPDLAWFLTDEFWQLRGMKRPSAVQSSTARAVHFNSTDSKFSSPFRTREGDENTPLGK